jgi:hypothetical protein
MTLLFILIAVFIVLAVWAFYRPQQRDEMFNKAKEAGSNIKAPIMLKRWADKIGIGRRKRERLQRFKAWAGGDLTGKVQPAAEAAPAFSTWLDNLSEKELAAFVQRISGFCADLNFELTWLFDPEIDNAPALKEALTELVLLFALVQWKALEAQDDIKVFSTFLAWQAGKARKLTPKLFMRLVEQELIDAPPPALFLAPERERQAHMVDAIKKFVEKDRQAFNVILKDVIFASTETSGAAEVETPAELASVAGT